MTRTNHLTLQEAMAEFRELMSLFRYPDGEEKRVLANNITNKSADDCLLNEVTNKQEFMRL